MIRSWYSADIGTFCSGTTHIGLRCRTVRESAAAASWGISWTPLEPVPMMATRLPLTSSPDSGHCDECDEAAGEGIHTLYLRHVGRERKPTAGMR